MDYVVFDMDWFDVPQQDYPVGNLAVCRDPKRRLGPDTWAVIQVNSEVEGLNAIGLFGCKDLAIQFAESFSD